MVKALYVYPQTSSISGENSNSITIKADEMVLYNSVGLAVRLSNVDEVNDRTGTGAGGVQGSWVNNHWYDVYVIYNSSTTDVSSMIISSGATPKTTTISYPADTPAGYDYWMRVASVKHEGDTVTPKWREWYEYGMDTTWVYRGNIPTGYGLTSGGYTLTHYLGVPPRDLRYKVRINTVNATITSWGYSVGDQLNLDDVIMDYNDSALDMQPIGSIVTSTQLKIWKNFGDRGFAATSTNGKRILWQNYYPYLEWYIYAKR
jgi:hypothetical protein